MVCPRRHVHKVKESRLIRHGGLHEIVVPVIYLHIDPGFKEVDCPNVACDVGCRRAEIYETEKYDDENKHINCLWKYVTYSVDRTIAFHRPPALILSAYHKELGSSCRDPGHS
jgi:hypothetical protein